MADGSKNRSAALQAAWNKSETINPVLTNEDKLNLYAYGKIADGMPFSEAKKPGMFDLARKAMYNRWQELNDQRVSPSEAEKKYIELVDQLAARHGTK
ncbi:hypothetical protein AOQ84DRAFT_309119 [Glonium stellatum]|uniref:ACB domain-containing protein n=1 Tax=Glonium stellatum TaxID=574774 RepID=A0A8E2JYE3_9PEZI|nr:hypothetical protein AOQ84DRAFT_309119 [Glonium stellatum]